jgi:hypothetical protein
MYNESINQSKQENVMENYTVYYITHLQDGKEAETRPYTTRELAKANIYSNNYYIPVIVNETVDKEEYLRMLRVEQEWEIECEEWGQISDLVAYRQRKNGN